MLQSQAGEIFPSHFIALVMLLNTDYNYNIVMGETDLLNPTKRNMIKCTCDICVARFRVF